MGDTQSDHIPYRYQDEVFRRAKKDNVIAALNTGSGKTLISILLIKWIASQDNAKGKVIVFLVPRVTLVDQQAETVSKRTPLRVSKVFGATEIDMDDRAGWKKRIENQDVFVMTPQIFLNLITHGIWSIQKVSLMIFDECHHARKNHPYNGILREYFQVEPSLRPKVFGMTASPVWNTRNPQDSIAQLEANMNAKVIGIHENVNELEEKSPKPEERIQSYPFPPISYDCPLTGLFSCLALIDKSVWKQLGIPFYPTLENRYLSTFGNLGPYSASLFLYFEIQHLLHNLRQERHFSDDTDVYMGVINPNVAPKESHGEEINFVLDILKDFKSFFPSDPSSHDIPISVNLDWCTPKVKVLVDLLVEFGTKCPSFQCVIFVEQRQVASTLSKLLQVIPELNPRIKTAFLVGQGTGSEGLLKSTDQYSGDSVKMFKNGLINVLVATSVAEEGLDFKACDLVIRFDGLHHMVSYVQSRGRARKKVSTFVVMVPEGQEDQLAKYLSLKNSEDRITHIYRTRHLESDDNDEDDAGDEEYSLDLLNRERFVVESTGAVLSYDNALHLLGLLCSQIPCDPFTPAHKPKFRGEFQSTLYLPQALPLRPEHLKFYGPPRHSKKEAKRAVAFMAVKKLRELDVFDEYLLPISTKEVSGDGSSSTGSPSRIARNAPPIMSVLTRDPWCIGQRLWLHCVIIDGTAVAGLVTGTRFPPVDVVNQGRRVGITSGELLSVEDTMEHHQLMEDFTRFCIFFSVTASPLSSRLSLYLIPITQQFLPDYLAMENLVSNPRGCTDWSRISEKDYDRLLVLCLPRFGSVHLLHRIRDDLTPMSKPDAGSRESAFPTYHEYWQKSWTTKNRVPIIATEGPIIETRRVARSNVGSYNLHPSEEEVKKPIAAISNDRLLPQVNCAWVPISHAILEAYGVLPTLCHRVTHVCRAQYARLELSLPAIPDDLLIEALTIPSATFSFNNQRLETLGDAVLQVCTTVHLFHQYPNRHEGQLTRLRHEYVCNNYLLRRALDLGLERYIICETPVANKWRFLLSDKDDSDFDGATVSARYVMREFPRRSLQDCMEAILGASFLAGGINMALQTGTSLGIEFGGPLPWFQRYVSPVKAGPLPPLFAALEERLGYRFQRQDILREALTHPSTSLLMEGQWSPSYQRLEFLGDAILELVVTRYLYDKFPQATSHELSHPRTKAICSPTLAFLAVKRLGLHEMMLADSYTLNLAIANSVSILEELSAEEIVKEGWRYDPPKALSDIFESVMGAVFIDSGCDYEKTAAVMEHVMEDALEVLSPAIAQNPVSELLEWLAAQGCTKVRFEKRKKLNSEREGMLVNVHGVVVAGPIFSTSRSLSKFAVAERSLAILRDPQSEKFVERLCTCHFAMQVDSPPESDMIPSDIEDDLEVSAFLWPTDSATGIESGWDRSVAWPCDGSDGSVLLTETDHSDMVLDTRI